MSSTRLGQQCRGDRTAKWALAFDHLLADRAGLFAFMVGCCCLAACVIAVSVCLQNFTEREFSDENIRFWIACDNFRQLTDIEEVQ